MCALTFSLYILFVTVPHVLHIKANGSHIILILLWLGQSSKGHYHSMIMYVCGGLVYICRQLCPVSHWYTNDTLYGTPIGVQVLLGIIVYTYCFILLYKCTDLPFLRMPSSTMVLCPGSTLVRRLR